MILQRYILVLGSFLILIMLGCGEFSEKTYDLPYIEDGYDENDSFYLHYHKEMCDEKPDVMFCTNLPSVGTDKPTYDYAVGIVEELRKNTEYEVSNEWFYTETVYEFMVRDCEDEAMTMIHHMVDEGIDKKYLFMVYQLTSDSTAHIFVGIDTSDRGMQHMDVNTKVAPIEAQINFHMRMDDAGVYKWIKGQI